MTKAELIDKVAKDAGISKVAAAAALQSFMDNVTKALSKGRNPQTGDPIKIKASTVVKFKAGKGLKDAV